MILTALREATRPLHQKIEDRIRIMDRIQTLEKYRLTLIQFRGFHSPIEALLGQLDGWRSIDIDLDARRKTPWIDADLMALGLPPAEIGKLPACPRLPAIRCLAEGMGALYVLEGSTLGGQYIRKEVEKSLGLHGDSGCAFFQSYGVEVGSMWRSFVNALERFAETEKHEKMIINSAIETFESIDLWFTRNDGDVTAH